ncbi:SAVMC3_10250 family protein [Actinomadura rugatobispora]|uniref:SAVMC3_10250 family protein n=1 Tax=Actinomadura rugatobispora TaxID=1994 RepID=A0ABW1AGI3_9ACTN|nr:hypothetical protein GCM10010200_019350 [Actinomadura rugatobispora]
MNEPPAVHQAIVCVDVEKFTDQHRTNPHQLAVRRGLYQALDRAFDRAGVLWQDCYHEDRGDGAMILVPPEVPKKFLVVDVLHQMAAALAEHNDIHDERARIRLRMALHAGEIHRDDHGVVGEAINFTFRLLEATPLKQALAQSSGALAVIASQRIFEDVIRHTPASRPASYRQVQVSVKNTEASAWISSHDDPHPPVEQVTPFRDLLYLSENKMRVLSPQVPQQIWKKAGFEAGVNGGPAFSQGPASRPFWARLFPARARGDAPQSSVTMLDPVIEMIEQQRKVRWFTDERLHAGDWVQFEDEFFYGDAAPAGMSYDEVVVVTGLVYFAARPQGTPFVLIGSSANVLDRWQPPDSHIKTVGAYYVEAVRAYAARLARLPDEAAESEFTPPRSRRSSDHNLVQALRYLAPTARSVEPHSGWAAGPVTLRGHARVLATPKVEIWGRAILATPLYVEYAPDDD